MWKVQKVNSQHWVSQCPLCSSPQSSQPSTEQVNPNKPLLALSLSKYLSPWPFSIPVQIRHSEGLSTFAALIDSGTAGIFIYQTILRSSTSVSNLHSTLFKCKLWMELIVSDPSNSKWATYFISFLVTTTSKYPIFLGFPWMQTHNLHIFWAKRNNQLVNTVPRHLPPWTSGSDYFKHPVKVLSPPTKWKSYQNIRMSSRCSAKSKPVVYLHITSFI